jgi:hypothetical protein
VCVCVCASVRVCVCVCVCVCLCVCEPAGVCETLTPLLPLAEGPAMTELATLLLWIFLLCRTLSTPTEFSCMHVCMHVYLCIYIFVDPHTHVCVCVCMCVCVQRMPSGSGHLNDFLVHMPASGS